MQGRHALAALVVLAVAATGCGGDGDVGAAGSDAEVVVTVSPTVPAPDVTATASEGCGDMADDAPHPRVVDATAVRDGDSWELTATLCSPYDSAQRYADAWRASDPDGNVLAVRELGHPHTAEQPFTRGTTIPLPDDVTTLVFEGSDLVNGWGGDTFELEIRAD